MRNHRQWSLIGIVGFFAIVLLAGVGAAGPVTPIADDANGVNITAAMDGTGELGVHSDPEPLSRVYGSPYDTVTLTVAVSYESDGIRNMSAEVNRSLRYWERMWNESVGYPVVYERVRSTDGADLHLEFVESLTTCGSEINEVKIGCADFVEDDAPEQVEVRVESGRTYDGTTGVLIHELGHTLGLTHDDEPQYYMEASLPLSPQRQEVGVEVVTDGSATTAEMHQISSALAFLETHPDLDNSRNFTIVEETVRADVVIQIDAPDADWHCEITSGSCVQTGVYTYEDQYHIATRDLDTEALGWHVGANLALALFEEGDMPYEFRDERTYEFRRSEWWD